jgi:hypothetical protein
MAEYIEREALEKHFRYNVTMHKAIINENEYPTFLVDHVLHEIRNAPSADVVEVRHGYWYLVEYEYFTCSECGNSCYNGCKSTAEAKSRLKDGLYDNYCPHCGAKMDGKEPVK